MSTMLLGKTPIEVKLSQRRRTVSIQVRHGKVRVLAPNYVSHAELFNFIASKQHWIDEKVNQQSEIAEQHPIHLIVSQQLMPYKGKDYAVCFQSATRDRLNWREDQFLLMSKSVPQEASIQRYQSLFQRFYANEANVYLPERVNYWAKVTNLYPAKLVIKRYKARWGSCNSKKEVSLNYYLMMAPIKVIDYVVVHELCHLVHLNHSSDFWSLVAEYLPDINEQKAWLKTNGYLLDWSR